MPLRIAISYKEWNKKTYNNKISALRRAFEFGYRNHPEHFNPATALKGARMQRRDFPRIDPFRIQDAEALIAAIHKDWGELADNLHEFRFFTGLRPSEEIALTVRNFDEAQGTLSVTRSRVYGVDKNTTKTHEDRIIELCPRAIAVLKRQRLFIETSDLAGESTMTSCSSRAMARRYEALNTSQSAGARA